MASSTQARLYQRCASGRFEDAQILLDADHTTGAVYLAGYGVECILKALILSSVPPKGEAAVNNLFRGVRAHNYHWLREVYFENGGSRFPRNINQKFTLVEEWSTELRYLPRTMKVTEARDVLAAANQIISWMNERI